MSFTGTGSGRFQMTRVRKGDSQITVYQTVLASAGVPATPAAGTTFPPTGWSTTASSSVAENSVQYSINGIKNELTGIYAWSAPVEIGRGPRGAGFYRISRTGAKPAVDFTTTYSPTLAEYRTATGITGAEFVTNDLAIITYASADIESGFSWAVSYNGSAWEVAGTFIDGNLVVDGTVFTTASYSVNIPDINAAINWDSATDETPIVNTSWTGSGAFMGFANNDTTGSTVQQEVLLVGDKDRHLFFDGENVVINGATLQNIEGLSNATVSDTEPTDPSIGDIWFDTDTDSGVFLIYTDQGWVREGGYFGASVLAYQDPPVSNSAATSTANFSVDNHVLLTFTSRTVITAYVQSDDSQNVDMEGFADVANKRLKVDLIRTDTRHVNAGESGVAGRMFRDTNVTIGTSANWRTIGNHETIWEGSTGSSGWPWGSTSTRYPVRIIADPGISLGNTEHSSNRGWHFTNVSRWDNVPESVFQQVFDEAAQ